ncbi:Saposin-like protein [Dioscorea alata]|uniref:Saposin-like protein n=1 Tax=Dioscorea alata TaxID=55571 RepID=A0ACB7U138_DIOAL|nr:Saposin-like protein [Dioscorea alata]
MGLKIVLLALFALSISWISSGARELSASDITGVPIEYKNIGDEKIHEVVEKNNQLCAICEEYTAEALSVLGENKTQMDIISILHKACSQLPSLEEQFEIIEILLKQCSKVENYAQECKRLVFEYGPLILASGEKFFETNDVCSIVLSCTSSKTESIGSAQITEASLTDA